MKKISIVKGIFVLILITIFVGCSSTTGQSQSKIQSSEQTRRAELHVRMNGWIEQKKEEFLTSYANNILSPSDVEKIDWSDIGKGFSYTHKIVHSPEYNFERVWRLDKVEGNKYFFNSYENGKQGSNKKIYVDGRESSSLNIKIRGKEANLKSDHCDNLVEGECEYKIYDTNYKKVIKYENGIWKTTIYKEGKWKSDSQTIYDKRGIKLFSSLHSLIIRKHISFTELISISTLK